MEFFFIPKVVGFLTIIIGDDGAFLAILEGISSRTAYGIFSFSQDDYFDYDYFESNIPISNRINFKKRRNYT